MQEIFGSHTEEEASRVAYLIAGFIRNNLSEKEHDELDEWVTASFDNQLLFEELTEEETIDHNLNLLDSLNKEKVVRAMKRHRNETNQNRFWKYTAAAASLLLIGTYLAFKFIHTEKKQIDTQLSANNTPTHNKAILTLSDGKTISLNDAPSGMLKKDKDATITKTANGEILYAAYTTTSLNSGTNTLTTPKGGRYMVQLADGSKVWLNAASSLQYTTSFTGNERLVTLRGEAYFEIAKNPTSPFKVKLHNDKFIEVIGTQFNVMSYENEPAIQTSLLDGSIKIETKILKPGQQAIDLPGSPLTIHHSPDLSEVLAWKNNNFQFHDASLEKIMRQISRWYDVTIIYQSKTDQLFNAEISRNEPVTKVLQLLELTNRVHFKIENKTIYVLP